MVFQETGWQGMRKSLGRKGDAMYRAGVLQDQLRELADAWAQRLNVWVPLLLSGYDVRDV
jgi:hypothetical protein